MCEHCEEEIDSDKSSINRIIISVVILILGLFESNEIYKTVLFVFSYLLAGYGVIIQSLKNIIRGKIFDENFLMSIATVGAMFIGEWVEAVCVMIFYTIGEYLQDKAVDKSHKSIEELMNLKTEHVNLYSNGEVTEVEPQEVKVGSVIIVKVGEKIPVDGVIIEGESSLDTSSLTGESVLKPVKVGDSVLSGCINSKAVIKIRAEKLYVDSAVSKIMELIENAQEKKSDSEKFITKFAKVYTPIVVLFALIIILIPFVFNIGSERDFVQRALTFLVISCPCALVLSVPLTFFAGVGRASKESILIKGSTYIEKLAKAMCVVLDKTGTITEGVYKVNGIYPLEGVSESDLIKYAAIAEYYSNHPVALAIKEYYGKVNADDIKSYDEIAGMGVISHSVEGEIIAGNLRLMSEKNINIKEKAENASAVYITKNSEYLGYIIISDKLKESVTDSVRLLKGLVKKVVMLTGDSEINAKNTAKEAGIDEVYYELLPSDKVEKLEEIIQTTKGNCIYAGDGINDAPVIMRSDVGIAMGNMGSDAAIEAADVVIANDNPYNIYRAIMISKETLNIVMQNIVFAIGVKVIFLILSAMGLMTMWGAVFADVGVTFLAVLNALRLLKK